MKRLFLAAAFLSITVFALQAAPQPSPAEVDGCYFTTVAPTVVNGQRWVLRCDANANLLVNLATGIPASSNVIGKVGIDQTTPGSTNGVVDLPTSAANGGLTVSSTASLASSQTFKASAGNLYSFEVSADSTLSGAAWWIMLFDATSAPADGAVTPKKCYAMASGATMLSSAFPMPIGFTTGITAVVSTTGCFTKTASAHAFISGDAQ